MIELLPYNWEWKGVSRIYKNITMSMGDIHHFAWRAKHPKWAVYPSEHEARYAEWTAEECASRYGGPYPTMSVSLQVSHDEIIQCNLSSEQMSPYAEWRAQHCPFHDQRERGPFLVLQ